MSDLTSSSVAKAVKFILYGSTSRANSNPHIHILDFQDLNTFQDLWLKGLDSENESPEINGSRLNWTDGNQQILIVGNDPPDGVFDTKNPALAGINFRSHFTATSWLAAWKVKFSPTAEEKNKGAKESLARIAVIDPRPAGQADGVARPLQAILSARDAAGHPLVPGATVLNAPSLAAICDWLAGDSVSRETSQEREGTETFPQPSRPPRHLRETSKSILALLKSTIWNELTSDREQHHALNNVLGAFLLSIQVGKGESHGGEPWVQDYLLALVQALGVEASLDQVRLKEHGGFQRWITPAQQREIGGIVLIDDMADLWSYFLRGATGFAGNAVFDNDSGRTYHESLQVFGQDGFAKEIPALPGRLKKFFDSRKPHLSAADLLGGNAKLGETFTLCLDLRLFPTGNQGKPTDAEGAFFKDLRDVGKALLESKRNLPWARRDDLARLKAELDRWADDPGGKQPLDTAPRETLLPRLIALLDPTLPIVVFSSTHRTELVEPFRGYGNIITDFHKPVVSGLAGDWPQMVREMHSVFLTALDRAAAILRVRKLVRPFQKSLLQN